MRLMRNVCGPYIDLILRCEDAIEAEILEGIMDKIIDLSYMMWSDGRRIGIEEAEDDGSI